MLFRRAYLVAFVGVLCWASSGLADVPLQSSFAHHMAQGRYLLGGGLYAQALAEFEAAETYPEAEAEAELFLMTAIASYELDRVDEAIPALRRAIHIAMVHGGTTDRMVELSQFLESSFVEITAVGAGPDARLPVPVQPLLDPKLKRVLSRAVEQLIAPGPEAERRVYLPVTAYRIGVHIVELKAGAAAVVDLSPTTGVRTDAGVYGEGRAKAVPAVDAAMLVQLGLAAIGLQGEPGTCTRLLIGVQLKQAARGLFVRLAGQVSMRPVERLRGDGIDSSPAGLSFGFLGGLGLRRQLTPKLALVSGFGWSIGYARPLQFALPSGYRGPIDYLVQGPDVELSALFLPRRPVAGTMVEPMVGLRLLLRLHHPSSAMDDEQKVHLVAGLGVELGLRFGR
ncbi:MAG: hypothetical protein CMP23_07480 [Rickettsiales bacterium]|nr:hypothetical protein [Rickettsiales bacterium]